MVKAKERSQEGCRVIIEHCNHGMEYQKISKELNIPISMIRVIIWKWKQHGLTMDLPQTGCPLKLSEWTAVSVCQEGNSSEFEHQFYYYIPFQTNTFGKGMDSLIPIVIG